MNSNNENGSPLDILMMYCLAILLAWAILLFRPMTAHAQTSISYPLDFEVPVVDKEEYPYYGCFSSGDVNRVSDDKYTVHTYGADFYSKYPVFCVYITTTQGYALKCYNPTTQKIEMCGSTVGHIFPIFAYHKAENQDGKEIAYQNYPSNGFWIYGTSPYVKDSSTGPNISGNGDYYFSCNVIGFDSDESAIKYYRDGDGSGIIFRPPPDYDYDHDFREDVYDPDIPVPELSNLSHNGFHVNNADPTRDIEIYMTSTFYGVKHNSNIAINFDADKSWVFNTHRYNLINTDISYSDADIDILKMFRVDNVKALTEDFKKWSSDYPTHNSLPDCKSFRHQPDEDYNIDYKWYHTYYGNPDKSSDARLHDSKQTSTTYLVRFCQYVPGEGYTWGKWVSYTYTPAGYGQKDNVTIGDVEIDPDTGDPSITNPQPGKQDPSTGDVDYGNGTVNIDSSDLWATIKSLVNDMGAIPEIIGGVLSFLPSWILYMIAAGIAACVILRFVGR